MLLRVLPAIRSTSRRAKEVRARVWQGADVVARAGLPPSAVVGVRLALEPGGRGASVPMRVALAGSVIGIAAVAAAFTFGASFDRLLDTPAEYGWNWDVIVGGGENQRLLAAEGRRLVGSADVAELAAIAVGHVTRGSENFVALSFRPIEGSVEPTLLEGRHAASRDEVALGTTTMRREGLTLGDTIELPGTKQACGGEGGCQLPFEVVGRVVVASLDGNPMDEGGIFTADGHARLDGSVGFTDLAVRLSKGTDLREPPPVLGQYRVDWLDAQRPIELQNLSRVRLMPHVLAGLLGFLAVATLTHALVTSVRRRRHDLAVLKTIGFDRGQLARTVAWQASTLIVLALLLALPLGIVGGRWGWLVMNSTLGAGVAPLVPTAAVALGAAATLAIANAVAFVPARSAARTRAAVVLRTE
jgi:hypothetical protein